MQRARGVIIRRNPGAQHHGGIAKEGADVVAGGAFREQGVHGGTPSSMAFDGRGRIIGALLGSIDTRLCVNGWQLLFGHFAPGKAPCHASDVGQRWERARRGRGWEAAHMDRGNGGRAIGQCRGQYRRHVW